MLAKTLVELDIAVPGDWARADHDPISFVRLTLDRWIQAHGGPAIRRRFLLSVVSATVPVIGQSLINPSQTGYSSLSSRRKRRCGCANFGPTLQLLEGINPQLPATFYRLFVSALNTWTRIYDYRDAEDRVDMLREWAAQEPNADEYEIPDVAGIDPAMPEARATG